MDFSNRVQHQAPNNTAPTTHTSDNKGFNLGNGSKSWRAAVVVILAAVAVIVIALALLFVFNGNSEAGYVNKSTIQAVDVNVAGGTSDQLYFGNIKSINSNYLVLDNVFFFPSSSSSNSNLTLEPIVCQIHAPYSQIIIRRTSVNWWENLQSSGKVAQAISNYEKKQTSCNSSSSNGSTAPSTSSPSSNSNSSSTNNSSSSTSSSTGSTSTTTPGSSSTTPTTTPKK